jgi:hypothetical protein
MVMVKHTRGPWRNKSERPAGHQATHRIYAESGKLICSIIGLDGEDEANAHLLAAAPEMLAMLRDCRATFAFALDAGDGEAEQFIAEIDAVLAKAGA